MHQPTLKSRNFAQDLPLKFFCQFKFLKIVHFNISNVNFLDVKTTGRHFFGRRRTGRRRLVAVELVADCIWSPTFFGRQK